ncbi:hypothetical protein VTN00DRAFT_1907 [Thermoascus crustaceus]|uniref:uncharacterized protein n=1 Tax=Thermoascus crustaceus TaxID=5088 RepID=UPI0037423EC2
MAGDVDLQQEILAKTLEEVAHDNEDGAATPCVICLDSVSEPSVAVPCKHASFDFLCLLSWLEQRPACPLCKSEITAVKYDLQAPGGPKLYRLPPQPPKPATTAPFHRSRPEVSQFRGPRPRRRPPPRPRPPDPDDPLTRRRHVYRHKLFSLRVGSNRLSKYRELTPQLFNQDEELVSRARKWIRRELQVFTFLNPDAEADEGEGDTSQGQQRVPRPGQQRLANRRANNAEFLLEYIIAILRTVDIKGSAGQAEELLQEFIGRDNARLFLHELQSWLRSPYTSLQDWDRNVQYEDTVPRALPGAASSAAGSERADDGTDRRSTPVYRSDRSDSRSRSGRVSKPYSPRNQQRRPRSRDAYSQARRLQFARDRYPPD